MADDDISANDLPLFDAAEQLRSEEDIAAYLAIVQEENDPAALEQAHATVARARQVAGGHRPTISSASDEVGIDNFDIQHVDIEKVARAVEADAGQALPGLRESLMQARRGEYAAVHTPEQIAARRAQREKDVAGQSADVPPQG